MARHCRKCQWCAKYDDYDVMANTHTPVYHCQFPGDTFRRGKTDEATLDNQCPYFDEPYREETDDD